MKVRGECEVAAFVELFGRAGPPAIILPPLTGRRRRRGNLHDRTTAGSVLFDGAAELGHRYDDDVAHAIAEIAIERAETVAEVAERLASCPRALPWFACVSHPPRSANATSSPTFDFTS